MSQYFQQHIKSKIQDWQQAQKTVYDWQNSGLKIVFTNGCFDLVHYGHLHYLSAASELGAKLVVALNSDASISLLKGKNRPIKDAKNRLHLMASLQVVDLVVSFGEDTPLELIKLLQPDILVKGGDWKPSQIVGSQIVLDKGGSVHSLPFITGYSTSLLEQKIIKSAHK